MPLEKAVEALIREAMERGEFENLHGRGKSIDLDPYFETPAELRAALSMLKNAGIVPEEVELLREIASLKESMATAGNPAGRAQIRRRLCEKQLRYNLLMERRRR